VKVVTSTIAQALMTCSFTTSGIEATKLIFGWNLNIESRYGAPLVAYQEDPQG